MRNGVSSVFLGPKLHVMRSHDYIVVMKSWCCYFAINQNILHKKTSILLCTILILISSENESTSKLTEYLELYFEYQIIY